MAPNGQHPWLRLGRKILPRRMGYYSSIVGLQQRQLHARPTSLGSHAPLGPCSRLSEAAKRSSSTIDDHALCLNNKHYISSLDKHKHSDVTEHVYRLLHVNCQPGSTVHAKCTPLVKDLRHTRVEVCWVVLNSSACHVYEEESACTCEPHAYIRK